MCNSYEIKIAGSPDKVPAAMPLANDPLHGPFDCAAVVPGGPSHGNKEIKLDISSLTKLLGVQRDGWRRQYAFTNGCTGVTSIKGSSHVPNCAVPFSSWCVRLRT